MLAILQRDLNTHGLRRQTSTGGEDLLDCGCKPCYLNNMVCGGRPRDARALFAAEAGLMMRGLSLMITQLGLVLMLMLMLMLMLKLMLKQAKH